MNVKLNALFNLETSKPGPPSFNLPNNFNKNLKSSSSQSIISSTFFLRSGSENIFGNIYSHSKPLQYNFDLKAITFFHKKSVTYSPSQFGNSGSIVALVLKNNGSVVDSSCIYTNSINLGSDVQGLLYNPPVNLNVSNAYYVCAGTTKTGSVVSGSYRASKQVGLIGTNTPANDQQFFSNISPFSSSVSPSVSKHDLPNSSITHNYDGKIRLASTIYNNVNGSTAITKGIRGFQISTGTFNSGVFVWTSDSIIPPVVTKGDGTKQVWSTPYMAWDCSGNIGYFVCIGSKIGQTGSNIGWQPIIYKTTNGGLNWNLINSIDFNTSSLYSFVLNSIDGIQTNNLNKIPFFNPAEGIDLAVDWKGDLHIVSTVLGTAKNHVDSLSYVNQYLKNGETYSWQYKNTKWPYIFDFFGNGISNWNLAIIDSVSTEIPSNEMALPGFSINPWANQSQSVAVSSGMRLQVSQTQNYILYSWAESDTMLTTNATKWNEFPNVKIKAAKIANASGTCFVSSQEFMISSPSSGFNPKVRDKAYFHHISPRSISGQNTSNSATFTVPVSVSNNNNTDGSLPVNHYIANSVFSSTFQLDWPNANVYGCGSIAKVQNNNAEIINTTIYPNPANNKLNILLEDSMIISNETNIEITDLLGKQVFIQQITSPIIELEISSLAVGSYIIQIKNQNTIQKSKLIISR